MSSCAGPVSRLNSNAAPTRPVTCPLTHAGEWAKLSDFRRLLILRALKPDRMPAALATLCERAMGAAYINQEPFTARTVLAERWALDNAASKRGSSPRGVQSWGDVGRRAYLSGFASRFRLAMVATWPFPRCSSPGAPIFFVLFPGYSPSSQIEAYARTGGVGAVDLGCATAAHQTWGPGPRAPTKGMRTRMYMAIKPRHEPLPLCIASSPAHAPDFRQRCTSACLQRARLPRRAALRWSAWGRARRALRSACWTGSWQRWGLGGGRGSPALRGRGVRRSAAERGRGASPLSCPGQFPQPIAMTNSFLCFLLLLPRGAEASHAARTRRPCRLLPRGWQLPLPVKPCSSAQSHS